MVEETNRSILFELRYIFKELQALCPISEENIPSNTKVLKSQSSSSNIQIPKHTALIFKVQAKVKELGLREKA
jgi:hypothetical protein